MNKPLIISFLHSSCFLFCSLIASIPTTAKAQDITADGTTSTTVTSPDGNNFTIDGGNRPEGGDNLFHSFQDFSVPTNGSAAFNNAVDIENIFSRVTGGNVSSIDGLIRANGSANLFLINPAGIIFGQNARLDIGGSFLGSTADRILFEDGSEFIATDSQNQPILTINAPIGLGFRDNPAEITVEGMGNGARLVDSEVIDTQEALRVDTEATIGLVGGKLRFEDATIKTAGGRIELGSVAGGQVNLRSVDNGWSFDYSAVENFSDISLSGRSNIDASGLGGGDIQVAGQNITLRGISAFEANTLGGEAGGDIKIFAAEYLEISGVENELNFVSRIVSRVFPNGNADGGDITIKTGSLRLGDHALIATSSFGQGNAGDITINTRDSVTLESKGNTSAIASSIGSGAIGNGGDIQITTSSLTLSNGAFFNAGSSGEGNAGNINISGNSLTLNNGADLSAANTGQGNGGNVIINTSDFIALQGEDADNSTGIFTLISENNTIGDAGNIELNTGSLTLNNGTDLSAANIGQGNGGNIIINTTDDVSFHNDSDIFVNGTPGGSIEITAKNLSLISDSAFFAGIASDSGFADAQSGDIVINLTEDLVLDGLEGENSTIINNSSFGTGNAGNIEISARNITFKNGGNVASFTNGEGDIGNVTLTATGDIWFDGIRGVSRSGIFNSVSEEATGDVGEINITAQNLTLTNGAIVQSQVSGTANSGDINLNVADTINVDGFGDTILEDGTQSVLPSGIVSNINTSGIGNSGNININTQNLSLSRNGQIITNVFGQGKAGNININANLITIGEQGNTTISPSSISSQAISGFLGIPLLEANGGSITINTGSLFIGNGGDIDVGVNAIGNAGDIKITAIDTVSVDGKALISDNREIRSGIAASNLLDSIGSGGNIEINAANFSLTNDAILTTSSSGQGNAGNISLELTDTFTADSRSLIVSNIGNPQGVNAIGQVGNIEIKARKVIFSDTAQIQAGLFSGATGTPGLISITASELISFTGENTGIFSNNDPGSIGDASNTQLSAPMISLSDGAVITANNAGQGMGGNVTVSADNLNLNSSSILASTVSNEGGIINLNIEDNLTLRKGSIINAQAFEDANGGNINIDAEFIIAALNQNNDIIASAEQGIGGNINITAEGVFGLEERSSTPPNKTNDIDASSEFGLDGTVSINTPDTSTFQESLETLEIVELETLGANACSNIETTAEISQFEVTGKGGVAPIPTAPLTADALVIEGQSSPIGTRQPKSLQQQEIKPIVTAQGLIYPARGIIFKENGDIILTAYPTDNVQRTPQNSPNCRK